MCENYSKDKIEGVRLLENCKMTTPISLNPIIRHKDLTPHETGYGNSTAVFLIWCAEVKGVSRKSPLSEHVGEIIFYFTI